MSDTVQEGILLIPRNEPENCGWFSNVLSIDLFYVCVI